MIVVYTDLHLYGAHKPVNVPLEFGDNIFYIGDIVDLKNCKKKDLKIAERLLKEITQKAGENYVPGNHELTYGNKKFIVYKDILLTHGDYFCWKEKRVEKWRGGKKKPGKISIIHLFFRFKNLFARPRGGKLSQKELSKIYNLANSPSYNCKTVIIGHKHPNKILEYDYKEKNGISIKVYVIPRGRNIIPI